MREVQVTEGLLSGFKALVLAIFYYNNVTQIYWEVVRANAKTQLNLGEDVIMACMEQMPFSFVMLHNQILYLVMED